MVSDLLFSLKLALNHIIYVSSSTRVHGGPTSISYKPALTGCTGFGVGAQQTRDVQPMLVQC